MYYVNRGIAVFLIFCGQQWNITMKYYSVIINCISALGDF